MTTERFLHTHHNASTAPSRDVPADLASFVLAAEWAHARKYFSLSEKYAQWADYRAPAKGFGIHAYAPSARLSAEGCRAIVRVDIGRAD
jgi:hypothetical protein